MKSGGVRSGGVRNGGVMSGGVRTGVCEDWCLWGLVSVWGVSMGRVCERKMDTEQNLEHSPPFPMRLDP